MEPTQGQPTARQTLTLEYGLPERDRAALIIGRSVAAAIVVGMVVQSFIQARKHTVQLADFGAYYRAGTYVAAGGTPYQLDKQFGELGAYMYCPAFAYVACRPLAALPYPWAVRAFMAVNWLATVGVVWLSVRLLKRPPHSGGLTQGQTFWVGLIGTAAVGMYLFSDIHNGQVGTLLLLCCLGWLTLTLNGRPILGGVILALAIGLKIYPLLLVPYLLLRREWWLGIAGVAIGLAILFITPALFVGSHGLLPLHEEWLRFCVKTQLPLQTYRAGNESLLGVLARTKKVSDGKNLFSAVHLATLLRIYPAIVLAITAALYGLVALRRMREPAVDVAVLLIWMTLASPRAWTFNLAAELPAAVLLARAVVRRHPGWPWAVAALVAPIYAVSFPTNPPFLPEPTRWTFGTQFLYDKHFLAAVVLAVAVPFFRAEKVGVADQSAILS